MPKHPVMRVENFAQIADANIEFGDLTILVGPQASGKSLLLQLWKLALDRTEIVPALREAGDDVSTRDALLESVFGQGTSSAWTDATSVVANGEELAPGRLGKWIRKATEAKVFYIPAHRGLLLLEGWAQPFGRMSANVPVVARLFSQALNERFQKVGAGKLSPGDRDLKKDYREAIDAALFHGGTVGLVKREGTSNFRLSLQFGKADLPYMAWTAGQREFTPMLFALMRLLPPRAARKVAGVDWIVIEEPEMGLHPQAINVVLMLVLEALSRGYRVVLSTHSPLVADFAWSLRRFRKLKADPRLLLDELGLPHNAQTLPVAQHALEKEVRVFALNVDEHDYRVRSQDISELDPSSEDEVESGWGGLTSFSNRIGNSVARAVNEAGECHVRPAC